MIRTPSLRSLDLFAKLMRTGSLTAAARCIGISQPAASLALKELELQTGFPLFLRARTRMVPTIQAIALLPDVERLLAQADQVHRQIGALHAQASPIMQLASTLSLSVTLLPKAISGFQRSQPGVHIKIDVDSASGVLDRVRNDGASLGFTDLPQSEVGPGAEPLLTTWVACLMSPHHPLAERRSISLEALRRHTTIFTTRGDPPPSLLRAQTGIERGAGTIEVSNVYTAMAIARQGSGVALLSPLLLLGNEASGLVGRILDAEVPLALAMVEPPQPRSRAVAALADEAHIAARQAAARLVEMGVRARLA